MKRVAKGQYKITGRKRERMFAHTLYLDILGEETEPIRANLRRVG